MKKLLNVAIIWQTLISLTETNPARPPCGPIRHGIIQYQTDSKISYKTKTGIDVQLIDNGSNHSIVLNGKYKGIMIIAMNRTSKTSVGSFTLSNQNVRQFRMLKCYAPRDTLRHLTDRRAKTGKHTFTWEGRCSSNVRFYIYTTVSANNTYQQASLSNPWLWNKLELPCEQSTSFKAQLNEVVKLKIGSSVTGSNQRRVYQRSWKQPAKPFSSQKSSTNENPTNERSPMYQWGEWAAWGACTNSCGSGSKQRRRDCLNTAQNGRTVKYQQCRGESMELETCHTGDCPVWNTWGSWSMCTRTCGEGLTKRRRYCLYGNSCPGEKEEKKACNTNKCDRDQMKHICKDKYPFCSAWKKDGYCEDKFSTWMVANCRYTCGHCTKDVVPECKDTYEHSCWRWKEDGECESETQQIRAFVRTKCQKSCGNCDVNDDQ